MERVSEAMADLFGVQVSTGFLDSLYSEGSELLAPFLGEVLAQLKSSDVVHMDETSDRLSKKQVWFHVASNENLTLLHANRTRGKRAVEQLGLLADFTGTAVHDRLRLYFDYKGATHALCGAHLIRNLASVGEVQRQSAWATGMGELLLRMKDAAQQARDTGADQVPSQTLDSFLVRYDDLVRLAFDANPAPAKGNKRNALRGQKRGRPDLSISSPRSLRASGSHRYRKDPPGHRCQSTSPAALTDCRYRQNLVLCPSQPTTLKIPALPSRAIPRPARQLSDRPQTPIEFEAGVGGRNEGELWTLRQLRKSLK
ncbi:MAG: transposase [Acidimicrobiaceae bacterium]|nr:transposase [Acidimicrobiaceae bacterium]